MFKDGEKVEYEATLLQGGQAIYTYSGWGGSIGYRVKDTSGLKTTYGFTTAAHVCNYKF